MSQFLLAGYTQHHNTISIRCNGLFKEGDRIYASMIDWGTRVRLSTVPSKIDYTESTVWKSADGAEGVRAALKNTRSIGSYWRMMPVDYVVNDDGSVVFTVPSHEKRVPPIRRNRRNKRVLPPPVILPPREQQKQLPLKPPSQKEPTRPASGDTISVLIGESLFEVPTLEAMQLEISWLRKGYSID